MTTSNTNLNYKADANTNVQILAVPRGARVEHDGTAITIHGQAVELKPVEPFTGTPPLDLLTDQREAQPAPFEVREMDPPANVSRLDTFRNRRDDDDNSEPNGAA